MKKSRTTKEIKEKKGKSRTKTDGKKRQKPIQQRRAFIKGQVECFADEGPNRVQNNNHQKQMSEAKTQEEKKTPERKRRVRQGKVVLRATSPST